jgi:glucose/arabinose dehydrogenase
MRKLQSGVVAALLLSIAFSSMPTIHAQTGLVVPPGFRIDVFYPGLTNPTSMTWGPDGNLYISQQSGEIIQLAIGSDGFPSGSRLVGKMPGDLLGLAIVGDSLFASYTGNVARLSIQNGTSNSTQIILSGLPTGRHQNDEIIYGKDGYLFMGIGSTGDRTNGSDPRSATIVRFKPDGSGFEVFAKGLRNPYGLAFDSQGNLFATDNGPDDPSAPDELNYIVKGGDYGFPNYFGNPPAGSGTIGPVALLQTHSSSDGFAFYYGTQFPAYFVGNVFIAQWGANSGDPSIGQRIVRVPLDKTGTGFEGQELVFATGFNHPIDVIEDHMGGLLVADYGTGTVYRISFESSPSSTATTTQTSPNALEIYAPEILLIALIVLIVAVIVLRRRVLKT